MKKITFGVILLILAMLAGNIALADTTQILNKLTLVDYIALSIGIKSEDAHAQIDTGKTLQQVAAENGMPKAAYNKRVATYNALFKVKKTTTVKAKVVKPAPKKATAIKKTPIKKVVVKKVVTTKKKPAVKTKK